ncbi:MAG: hypothetical protein IJ781_09235 [Atopobiaceae bacterium]|nr:hypothetical protein [Atopobiaceae bacterium]
MGNLIRFELRKILGNRAGMVACALSLAMMVGMAVLNVTTSATSDYTTGEHLSGFAAQQAFREWKSSHAGMLDDARVADDVADYYRAAELYATNDDILSMTAPQIIDAYGNDFYHESFCVYIDRYYDRLMNALEAATPQATSLEEGAAARLEIDLSDDAAQFPYSPAERNWWRSKAAQVSWPIEYGYADAWDYTLDYASLLGLAIIAACIALSGVFAGEYQERTAAVVLPTRRGKQALPVAKVVAALIFATAYWWTCAAVLLGVNVAVCGADGWGLPYQITNFANPYALTMGGAVLSVFALGYVAALGMAGLTLALSARLRSTMPVAAIPMAVVLMGLFGLFITPIAKAAALTPMAALNWSFSRLVSYAAGPVVADLPTVAALLYAAMLVALTPLAMRAFRRHQVA